MLRHLSIILLSLLSSSLFSQSIITDTMEKMSNGYVTFAVAKLKDYSQTGNIEACFYLARCYEKGYGINVDYKKAFFSYRKIAEKGYAVGQDALSYCYTNGIGTIVDHQKANYWKQKALGISCSELFDYIDKVFQEGLKHPENYALVPHGNNAILGNGINLAIQNNGNVNSNNNIGSNNQTINNITIVQASPNHASEPTTPIPQPTKVKSDVDLNIPFTAQSDENTFAIIIANENYQDVAVVPNALNDGEVFAEYCKKTLGMPSSNVVLVKDATLNNIKRELNKLSQIADAYRGEENIIIYYAGHGVPNESTKDAFLLPVDGYGTDTSSGYSLSELYATLGRMPAKQIVVLLDACFSGSQRGDGMLASARGIAIKAKPNKVTGNIVVISAAQGDETAYPYKEEGHGLFTYYLLKKLKETKGDVTLGDLASYIKDNVSKKSIVVNGKSQTPNVNPSASLGESWKNWTLK